MLSSTLPRPDVRKDGRFAPVTLVHTIFIKLHGQPRRAGSLWRANNDNAGAEFEPSRARQVPSHIGGEVSPSMMTPHRIYLMLFN